LLINKGVSTNIYTENIDTQGTRLYKARSAVGLSIKELANKIDVYPVTITNIELDRFNISQSTIIKLSSVLNVPIYYLGCYELLPEDTLGKKLRKARLYNGHTIKQLAAVLGSHEATVRQWEHNKYKISTQFASKIEHYLTILSQG
jgi:transcriptional regulator with XRE-family HTH domain